MCKSAASYCNNVAERKGNILRQEVKLVAVRRAKENLVGRGNQFGLRMFQFHSTSTIDAA